MTNNEIFGHIDHTLLKPTSAWIEIKAICEYAMKFKTASVCIPPSYVKRVKNEYGDGINICTVIGFPLGYNTTETKISETYDAINNGANEIDMVINLGFVKDGDFDKITEEIKALKNVCRSKILKVIIETCYLTEQEKIQLCKCVTDGGADFIKTSTGFGTDGARIEDIELFKRNIGKNVKIKAAGGVKSKADLEMFLNSGCDRIGTSSAVKILSDEVKTDCY